jgi:hypothetical protein
VKEFDYESKRPSSDMQDRLVYYGSDLRVSKEAIPDDMKSWMAEQNKKGQL